MPPATYAPAHKKWLVFLTIAVGVFMSTMDSSMVNIALPRIMDEFHSPLKKTQLVVSVYLLTITATLLLWGSLSDRIGKGKIYSRGVLVFTLGALLSSFSPSLAWLVLARFFQAMGASMIMATGPAIIREAFPPGQLGRGLGLIGVAVSLGLMIGPLLSGAIIEHFSWRAVFAVIVPVGCCLAVVSRMLFSARCQTRKSGKLDWMGSLLWSLSLMALSLTLTLAANNSLGAFADIALAALLFIFSFTLLIMLEKRVPHPFLPLHLFRHHFFSIGIVCAALSFFMLFTVTLLIPFYLDKVRAFSPMHTGVVMMAIPAAVLVVAPLAGWLSDIIGSRLLTSLGLLLNCLGLMFLAYLDASTPVIDIALRLAVLGAGQAMFLSPNSAAILGRVKLEHAGAAAAILATARNLGMFLGISLASLIFSISFRTFTNGFDMKDFSPQLADPFMVAFQYAFLVSSAIGVIGVFLSPLRGKAGVRSG